MDRTRKVLVLFVVLLFVTVYVVWMSPQIVSAQWATVAQRTNGTWVLNPPKCKPEQAVVDAKNASTSWDQHKEKFAKVEACEYGRWLCVNGKEKRGVGALFFAYGSNLPVTSFYVSQLILAAKSLKRYTPKLRTAIVTNVYVKGMEDEFDILIPVREDLMFLGSNYQKRPDHVSRQWFTRIIHMAMTPFELTLAYDADIVSCSNLDSAIQALQKEDFDIATASQGWDRYVLPHNFAIVYKWNNQTEALFSEWIVEQLNRGVAKDDQGTLGKAARRLMGRGALKLRKLHTSLATAYLSLDQVNGFYPRSTRVVEGEVLIIHEKDQTKADAVCAAFNQHAPRRRILVITGKKAVENVSVVQQNVLSHRACMEVPGMKGTCAKMQRFWEARGYYSYPVSDPRTKKLEDVA